MLSDIDHIIASARQKLEFNTAVHEAAHIVVATKLGGSVMPGGTVKVFDGGGGFAHVLCSGAESRGPMLIAGEIGSFMYGLGYGGTGFCGGDGSDAALVMKELEKIGGGEAKVKEWTAIAHSILSEPDVKSAVLSLAHALAEKGELSSREVDALLKPWYPKWAWWEQAKQAKDGKRLFPAVIGSRRTTYKTRPGITAGVFSTLSSSGKKSFTTLERGGRIVDYADVAIKGYLSTFKGTTAADRDGDYVEPGAFTATLKKFMANPILLANHENSVHSIAGQFTKLQEDKRGLYFEAVLSNAQSERLRHVRALVAEGHLRTVSMGGVFHYKPDGRGIAKVDLFEGSLTPIPSNPDAIFSTIE